MTPEQLAQDLQKLQLIDRTFNQEMLQNSQSPVFLQKTLAAMAQFLLEQNKVSQIPYLNNLLDPKFVLVGEAKTVNLK